MTSIVRRVGLGWRCEEERIPLEGGAVGREGGGELPAVEKTLFLEHALADNK
jgi:hypothetical protein